MNRSRSRHSRLRRLAGFTLVEAALSCVIIGVALVPAIAMVGAASADARAHSDMIRGMELARQLMSEIVQCHYSDPDGSEAGETRATWDDVSDYNGYTEATLTTKDGTALSGCAGWSRSVTVSLVNPSSPDTVSGTDVGLKRIVVTVTAPSGKTCWLSALRSSGSGYERPALAAGTYTASVNILLQAPGGDATVVGVSLPNQTP
jgi:MSHA pilin protein MshD